MHATFKRLVMIAASAASEAAFDEPGAVRAPAMLRQASLALSTAAPAPRPLALNMVSKYSALKNSQGHPHSY
jgi:hypothetical protein